MSQDERVPSRVDDGEIHEWLDGELTAVRAAELEELTRSSPEFAQRVAEARGLIAASSRILGALDDVPAGVLPETSDTPVVVGVSRSTAVPARSAPRWSLRRVSSIAALLMVGVTGVFVAQRQPSSTQTDAVAVTESEQGASAAATAEATGSLASAAPSSATAPVASAAPSSATAPVASAAPSSATAPLPLTARDVPAPPQALPSAAPGMPVSPPSVASTAKALALPSVDASARRTAQLSIDTQVAVQQRATQGGRAMQLRAAPSTQGGAPIASGSVLSLTDATSAESRGSAEIQSDIMLAELLFSVQRVKCAPDCVQIRVEIARDGRLRRWSQSLGSSSIADTSTLNATTLTALTERMASLQLETLPAILRLDGSKCRSVGSLRESLRVSFVHNNAPRQVMGLPWCTDGNHVLDRAAQLIEEAATLQLGGVSR